MEKHVRRFDGPRFSLEVDMASGLISATLFNDDGSKSKTRVLDADEAQAIGEALTRAVTDARGAGFPFVEVGKLLFPELGGSNGEFD